MNVLLYRRSVRLKSGAGELIRAQAEALRGRGHRALIGGERGLLDFWLRTRLPVRRMTPARAGGFAADPEWTVVDHDLRVPNAHLAFVHNLMSEANEYLQRADAEAEAAREAAHFRELEPRARIVANSKLVRDALVARHALDPERIEVLYPGYDAARFSPERAAALRAGARSALRLPPEALAIGFVTSGDMHKRGLDLFLASAAEIAAAVPASRFLVVGGARLPKWAAGHPLVRSGRVAYRPKTRDPAHWFAALDVFLYPARFEEYGLVVAEAEACGLPVITSRRVGAAECLPPVYEAWLCDAPDSRELARRAIALCRDAELRAALGEAGAASVRAFDSARYREASLGLLLRPKR